MCGGEALPQLSEQIEVGVAEQAETRHPPVKPRKDIMAFSAFRVAVTACWAYVSSSEPAAVRVKVRPPRWNSWRPTLLL